MLPESRVFICILSLAIVLNELDLLNVLVRYDVRL
jgi:hypothetical protein